MCFWSLFIYCERDRDSMSGRRPKKEGERENLKQAPRCQSRARRGARTHKTVRRWPEPKPRLGAQPTEPPRSPLVLHLSHRKNTTYMRDSFEVKEWSFTQICPMIFLINTDCSAPVSKWNFFFLTMKDPCRGILHSLRYSLRYTGPRLVWTIWRCGKRHSSWNG